MAIFKCLGWNGDGIPSLPPMGDREGGPQLHYLVDGVIHGGYWHRPDISPNAVEVDALAETISYMQDHPEIWEQVN